jgi:glycosyltransferase involved in cell wall biosynthesis
VLRFLLASSWWLLREHRRRPYDLVHVHSVPDFMVFAAWYSRLRGAKVILDVHDILPEFFASKFGVANSAWAVRALTGLERVSAALSHHVILANDLWLERYTSRSAVKGKCSVVLNRVDEQIFHPRRRRARATAGPVVMFPGGLQWHQGLDIAIRAFGRLRCQLPSAEFHIYGDGNMKPQLIALARDLRLGDCVRFFAPLPIRDIAGVMAQADLGVVAKRADSFGDEAYSTKIMEFMALGVPMVVSSTTIDRYYFADSVVRFFESGNDRDMARAMLEVLTDADLRRNQIRCAREFVTANSWERHKATYWRLVDALVAGLPIGADSTGPS